MNCQETRRYLLAHLDGELDAKTSFDVQDHLEGCPACAAEAKAVARESEQLTRALARPDAPVNELERRIEHALINAEREERRAGRKLFFRSSLALAASAVLALGLYFSLGQPALLHAADFAGQHRHCIHAIFDSEDGHLRTEHEEELDRALVPEPVEARLTRTGWMIHNAHKCRIGARVFYHVILGDGTHMASYFIALEGQVGPPAAALGEEVGAGMRVEALTGGGVVVSPPGLPDAHARALRAAIGG